MSASLFNMSHSRTFQYVSSMRTRVHAHIIGLQKKDVTLLTLPTPKFWCNEWGKCGIKNGLGNKRARREMRNEE